MNIVYLKVFIILFIFENEKLMLHGNAEKCCAVKKTWEGLSLGLFQRCKHEIKSILVLCRFQTLVFLIPKHTP